jgi:hypothetical protein
MRTISNKQPPNIQQQISMKFQITSYNHSYNELNNSYERKFMEHEELVHFGLSPKPIGWIMAF